MFFCFLSKPFYLQTDICVVNIMNCNFVTIFEMKTEFTVDYAVFVHLHSYCIFYICTRSEKIQHGLAMSNTVYCNAIIHYNTIQQSTLQLHCTQEAHTIILCL
jgi:hypothetical protein